MSMWSNLPLDLLAKIFSFLSPDSLAISRSVCKNWHTCSKAYPLALSSTTSTTTATSAWFLALPIRNHSPCCYAHNPTIDKWHQLSLPLPSIRPIAPIGSLLLVRVTNSTTLHLGLCNPFTGEFKHLPRLHVARTNPAVGVTISESSNSNASHDDVRFPSFRVYVAGGMSEAARGGATYETKVEMYDSRIDTWRVVGSTPVEFAVRLTVWTPNENVCIGESLYWVTSARAYSVMAYDVGRNGWREMGVPMAERLEFATLVKRNGALGLVVGMSEGSGCIWELSEGGKWCLVDKVPFELGLRLLGGKRVWESVKCVGNGDCICLYRDFGFGMVVCKRVGDMGRWEWVWVDGCDCIKGKHLPSFPIRGALLHPTLASSLIF